MSQALREAAPPSAPPASAEPAPTYETVPARLLIALVALLPPAWVLGMFPVLWLGVIPPVAFWAIRRRGRGIRVPRYFGAWMVFLLFAMASYVQVGGIGTSFIWALRIGWYLGATALLIHLMNERRATVPIGLSLLGLWVITIAGGWAGIVASDISWTGLFGQMLPGAVRDNSYIVDLTSPELAEVQRVGGEVLRRPAAPFAYTNNWGSTLSLLMPIAVLTAVDRRFRMSPVIVSALIVASLPPLLLSLNRGAWLSVVVAALYAFGHVLRRGKRSLLYATLAVVVIAVIFAVASGALAAIGDQLSARTADSDERRTALYEETIEETLKSPILGYGSPRQSSDIDTGPPVGTHGQLWMVMFSHGFIAAAGYVGFFVLTWLAFPARTNATIAAKAALLVGIFQLPFYGHLPQQLFVMMALVAMLHHEHGLAGPVHREFVSSPGRFRRARRA